MEKDWERGGRETVVKVYCMENVFSIQKNLICLSVCVLEIFIKYTKLLRSGCFVNHMYSPTQ